MSTSYSLFKNVLRKSIIDSIYNGVISKTERYYHWLGKENSWRDFLSPFIPSSLSDVPGPPANNFRYDLHVRRDILSVKSISASDVSYVIPRIDWQSGLVYDMYDDAYSTPIDSAIIWQAGLAVGVEKIIKQGSIYYISLTSGTLGTTPPTHVSGEASNGNVNLLYLDRDTFAASGATSLESSRFYVLTSEFNVYKCIWNNNDNPSTVMPTTTPSDALVTTADGYKWKFMYTIPISLRNRFLSSDWMPVTVAVKAPFFSDGEITQVVIENSGSGYDDTDIITVSGDGYLPDNPFEITDIQIINGGSGYTANPTLTFDQPVLSTDPDDKATGTASITSDAVTTTALVFKGFGYDRAPNILVSAPVVHDDVWITNAAVALGDIIKHPVTVTIGDVEYTQDIYYEVTDAGNLGPLPPDHITGAEENGTAELTVVATGAILKPTIVPTRAVLIPVIEDGEIRNVIIDEPGVGYTFTNIEITKFDGSPSDGTGADIRVIFDTGGVNTLQADVEFAARSGTIEVIKVVDKGSGYGVANVEILGDGTGATAVAVTASGEIVEVIVTDPGEGYTWTDVVLTGSGTGATARAIMSPIGGHGVNAIDELNANSLMFYSSISRDINQGIEINNDYRKAGLLKNLREFNPNGINTGLLFKEDTGSGCVLIEGVFDTTKIFFDLLLQKDGYKNYRVVDYTKDTTTGATNKILLSVFNNFPISVGDVLTVAEKDQNGNDNIGYAFTVTDVTERTIDQFSGDLLFLTVREPYSPTAEQIFTLRTVITI